MYVKGRQWGRGDEFIRSDLACWIQSDRMQINLAGVTGGCKIDCGVGSQQLRATRKLHRPKPQILITL